MHGTVNVDEMNSGWDDDKSEFSRGKRSNYEERKFDCEKTLSQTLIQRYEHNQTETSTRRFLRLCYFPVLWMHEYKRVVLLMNVPRKFQETENELKERMLSMVRKYGRMNIHHCSFFTCMHDMIWSIEAGRKKRVVHSTSFGGNCGLGERNEILDSRKSIQKGRTEQNAMVQVPNRHRRL